MAGVVVARRIPLAHQRKGILNCFCVSSSPRARCKSLMEQSFGSILHQVFHAETNRSAAGKKARDYCTTQYQRTWQASTVLMPSTAFAALTVEGSRGPLLTPPPLLLPPILAAPAPPTTYRHYSEVPGLVCRNSGDRQWLTSSTEAAALPSTLTCWSWWQR